MVKRKEQQAEREAPELVNEPRKSARSNHTAVTKRENWNAIKMNRKVCQSKNFAAKRGFCERVGFPMGDR